MDDIFRKKLGRHGGHFLEGSGDAIVDFFRGKWGRKQNFFPGEMGTFCSFCYNNKFGKNCGQARL